MKMLHSLEYFHVSSNVEELWSSCYNTIMLTTAGIEPTTFESLFHALPNELRDQFGLSMWHFGSVAHSMLIQKCNHDFLCRCYVLIGKTRIRNITYSNRLESALAQLAEIFKGRSLDSWHGHIFSFPGVDINS